MKDVFGKIYIDLREKPVIQQIGYSIHGLRREETFTMDGVWGLHVYFWKGELEFNGRTYPIKPNYASITPPDTPLTWRFPLSRCEHFFAHFYLARSRKPSTPVPVIQNLGEDISKISEDFEKAIALYETQPLRAEVILWNILWDIADPWHRNESSMQVLSTPVNASVAIIKNELRYKPTVSEIAERVGISQNHLNRMFKRELKMTIKQYIQNERIEKARHLLEHSNLPIRVIADEIGMSDPQHFNKFIRKRLGMSPRKYRQFFNV